MRTSRAWDWKCGTLKMFVLGMLARISCCVAFWAHEVFTYIDHVVADKASFILWIEECEKSKSAERSALQQMFGHPLFPSFCEAVSVPREKWGRDELYAMEELQLFQEWVAAKEIENTNPLQGMAPEPPRSDTMDTMETQLETQVDVSWHEFSLGQLCVCACRYNMYACMLA